MSPKQRFNITLEPEMVETLRALEKVMDLSASGLIRRAVQAYVNGLSPDVLEALRVEVARLKRSRRREAALGQ